MFAAPKNKILEKCRSTNNMYSPRGDERNLLQNVLYNTVIENFNMTSPSIKLAEEVTSFIKKSKNVNEDKVKSFVNKVSFVAKEIKERESQLQEAIKKREKQKQRKNMVLPSIPVKTVENPSTVSQESSFPKTFEIRQLIKNNSFLKDELKTRGLDDKIDYDDYYANKIKFDTNQFFDQQKQRNIQNRIIQQKYRRTKSRYLD